MNLERPQDSDMLYKTVGVLRDRTFDTFVASQHGGVVTYNKDVDDFYTDVMELITKLQNGNIDGMMLDSYALKFVTHYILHQNVTRWTLFFFDSKYCHEYQP